MKATELRIGNLVMGNTQIHIENIMENMINIIIWETTGGYSGDKLDDISPIPLTEEWLLKFGFVTLSFGDTERVLDIKGSSFIIEFFESTGFYHYSGGEGVKLSVAIQYVHQLQNLVFALTGEELSL